MSNLIIFHELIELINIRIASTAIIVFSSNMFAKHSFLIINWYSIQ